MPNKKGMKQLSFSRILYITVLSVLLSGTFSQTVNTEVNLNLQANERYVFDLSSAYNGCAESISWNNIPTASQILPVVQQGSWSDSMKTQGDTFPSGTFTQNSIIYRSVLQDDKKYAISVEFWTIDASDLTGATSPKTLLDSVLIETTANTPFSKTTSMNSPYEGLVTYSVVNQVQKVLHVLFTPGATGGLTTTGKLSATSLTCSTSIMSAALAVSGPSGDFYVIQQIKTTYQLLKMSNDGTTLNLIYSAENQQDNNLYDYDQVGGQLICFNQFKNSLNFVGIDFSAQKLMINSLVLGTETQVGLAGQFYFNMQVERINSKLIIVLSSSPGFTFIYSSTEYSLVVQVNDFESNPTSPFSFFSITYLPFSMSQFTVMDTRTIVAVVSNVELALVDIPSSRFIYTSLVLLNPSQQIYSLQYFGENKLIFYYLDQNAFMMQAAIINRPSIVLNGAQQQLQLSVTAALNGAIFSITINVSAYTGASPVTLSQSNAPIFQELQVYPENTLTFSAPLSSYVRGSNVKLQVNPLNQQSLLSNLAVTEGIIQGVSVPNLGSSIIIKQTSTSTFPAIVQFTSGASYYVRGLVPLYSKPTQVYILLVTSQYAFDSPISKFDQSGAFTIVSNPLRIYLPCIPGLAFYFYYYDATCNGDIMFTADTLIGVLFVKCGAVISQVRYQQVIQETHTQSSVPGQITVINTINNIGIDATSVTSLQCISGVLYAITQTQFFTYDSNLLTLLGSIALPTVNQGSSISQLVFFGDSFFVVILTTTTVATTTTNTFSIQQFAYSFSTSSGILLRSLDLSSLVNTSATLEVLPIREDTNPEVINQSSQNYLVVGKTLVFSAESRTLSQNQLISILPSSISSLPSSVNLFGNSRYLCAYIVNADSQCVELLPSATLTYNLDFSGMPFSKLYSQSLQFTATIPGQTTSQQTYNLVLTRDTSAVMAQINTNSPAIDQIRADIQDSQSNVYAIDFDDAGISNGNLLGWESLDDNNLITITNRLTALSIQDFSGINYFQTLNPQVFFAASSSALKISNLVSIEDDFSNALILIDESSITETANQAKLTLTMYAMWLNKLKVYSLVYSSTGNQQGTYTSATYQLTQQYTLQQSLNIITFVNLITTSSGHLIASNFDGSIQVQIQMTVSTAQASFVTILQNFQTAKAQHYLPGLKVFVDFYRDGTIIATLPFQQGQTTATKQIFDLKSFLRNNCLFKVEDSDSVDVVEHFSDNSFRVAFTISDVFEFSFVLSNNVLSLTGTKKYSYKDIFQTFIRGTTIGDSTYLMGVNTYSTIGIALYTNPQSSLISSSLLLTRDGITYAVTSFTQNTDTNHLNVNILGQPFVDVVLNDLVELAIIIPSYIQSKQIATIQPIKNTIASNILSFVLNPSPNPSPQPTPTPTPTPIPSPTNAAKISLAICLLGLILAAI